MYKTWLGVFSHLNYFVFSNAFIWCFLSIQMIENNDSSEEKIKLKQNMEGKVYILNNDHLCFVL